MNKQIEKNKNFSWRICGSPYFLLLIILNITFMLSNLVLTFKLVDIGPMLAPGSLFVLPVSLLIEDVIAEVYGYKISRLLVWFTLLSAIVFLCMVRLIIHLPSPSYWHLQPDYNAIFNPLMRALPIAIVGFLVAQFINIYVITKLKILMQGRFFWPRSIFASIFGSIVGVTISLSYAYTEIHLSWAHIEKLLLTDYMVRFAYAIVGGAPAWLLVIYLKNKEKIDIYDVGTNFNPFKLSMKD